MREDGARTHHGPASRDLYLRALALSFYRSVLGDEIGEEFLALLQDVTDPFIEDEETEGLIESFGHLAALLLREATDYEGEQIGDLWQNHLLDRVLADRNLFTASAERGSESGLGGGMLQGVKAELQTLQMLFQLSLGDLQKSVEAVCNDVGLTVPRAWPDWEDPIAARGTPSTFAAEVKRRLAAEDNWAQAASMLAGYYAEAGTGIFGRYRAFRWTVHDGAGSLEGVPVPDPITLQQLIGYEREQESVLRNTRHFVAGAPANNVLIYGDAGTGKSSLVKALLNQFGDQGLRLIEVAKEHLMDFPYIAQVLRPRKERFILFVDDLSFEEHETEYKGLKALLEGSVDARPENVLIYATSNRRHLVKEVFGDRDRPALTEEDVHPRESVEEKLSLSERFGIRVAFLAPDQDRYLSIVAELAKQESLDVPEGDLRRKAFQWAQYQNGFSGRTARQFINDLKGELLET